VIFVTMPIMAGTCGDKMSKMFRRIIGGFLSILIILGLAEYMGAADVLVAGIGLFVCASLISK